MYYYGACIYIHVHVHCTLYMYSTMYIVHVFFVYIHVCVIIRTCSSLHFRCMYREEVEAKEER